jgi:predicted dehydrogenase
MKYDRKVIVCHVLRYSPFYKRVKEILDRGDVGDIITVNASENVGYYHQAHSFVRGPWRNKEQSSPMILAKCCHDMDILRWLIGKRCLSVSSFGGLRIFKKENAPENSADYCSDCSVDCIYKAQKLYTDKSKVDFTGYFCNDASSDEKILRDLKHSQYDRCVYKCDNDVVDHQVEIMQFEDDITVSHTMTAFSKEIYRDIKIHGTKAELVGVMEKNYIEVRPYEGENRVITWEDEISVGGHSGGDQGMMHDVYLAFNGEVTGGVSFIDVSIDSHLMSFAAEESRLEHGKTVNI